MKTALIYGIFYFAHSTSVFFDINFSIAFFHYQNYLTAFIILLVLWVMIYIMMKEFKAINETAAKLLVPYFIWVTFAGYLNFAIFLLNH